MSDIFLKIFLEPKIRVIAPFTKIFEHAAMIIPKEAVENVIVPVEESVERERVIASTSARPAITLAR